MKKYTYIFNLLIIMMISLGISAQETILDENTYDYKDPNLFGQNRPFYLHYYLGYGLITPYQQDIRNEIIFGKSFEFELGLRFKYRFTNWLSIGTSMSYDIMNYRINQNAENIFPNNNYYIDEAKEKFISQSFSLLPYLRINIGRRGNKIGKYMDIGYFFNWSGNRVIEKYEDEKSELHYKSVYINPTYAIKNNQGIFASIGNQRYSIYAKYRITNLFYNFTDQNYIDAYGVNKFPELPRLTIGIQIGLF